MPALWGHSRPFSEKLIFVPCSGAPIRRTSRLQEHNQSSVKRVYSFINIRMDILNCLFLVVSLRGRWQWLTKKIRICNIIRMFFSLYNNETPLKMCSEFFLNDFMMIITLTLKSNVIRSKTWKIETRFRFYFLRIHSVLFQKSLGSGANHFQSCFLVLTRCFSSFRLCSWNNL